MKPILPTLKILLLAVLLQPLAGHGDAASLEPYLWEDAALIGNGWRQSAWYGLFSDSAHPWIWHSDHGWQWCVGSSPTNLFLWDQQLDCWIWTSSAIYPWVYKTGINAGWMYYCHIEHDGTRYFFHEQQGGYYSQNELHGPLATPTTVQLTAPQFSVPGNAFSGTQSVALNSDHPYATIRYTVDGSIPTEASAGYTEPLVLDRITQLRARLFVPGSLPGPVASEVFLAIDPSLADFDSPLPIVLIDSFGWNINAELYPRGADNPWPHRPVSAIFINTEPASGRASMSGNPDFTGRAGMRVRGNSTQNHFPKKSYKLETWDEQDADRDVSLLGFPSDSDWILHGPYSDKTLIRNYLTYSWSRKMGNYASRTRHVEVFANMDGDGRISMNDYLGVYVLMEKYKRHPDRIDIARLGPDDLVEPDISGGYILKADWGNDFQLDQTKLGMEFVDPEGDELTGEQADWIEAYINTVESAIYADDFRNPVSGIHYTDLLDPLSCIDRQLIQELTKNMDGRSTFLQKDRGGPLRFGPVWDYNYALGNVDSDWFWCRDCNGSCSCHNPEGWATFHYDLLNLGTMRWWARFKQDPDYSQYWADRWSELRRTVLSTDSIMEEIDNLRKLLEEPAARNFERWPILDEHIRGNSFWGTADDPHTYSDEIDWLQDWLMIRLAWLDGQYSTGPDFNQDGGHVPDEFMLEISNPNPAGTIYYTLDGTDPRVAVRWPTDGTTGTGSLLSAGAQAYSSPIAIEQTTEVQARVLIDDKWSPLHREVFTTGAAVDQLRITELQYHPLVAEAEFIELLNTGPEPIELNGIRFTDGIEFSFSAHLLQPGHFILLVADLTSFESVYGSDLPVVGSYSGRLSNGGESIHLVDAAGGSILEFTYSDNWFPETDGDGFSLEFIDPATADPADWNAAGHWRPSEAIGGSPGKGDYLLDP